MAAGRGEAAGVFGESWRRQTVSQKIDRPEQPRAASGKGEKAG